MGSIGPLCSLSGLVNVINRRLASKNIKVVRPTLFGYIQTKKEFEYYSGKLWELIKLQNVKVNIWKTYPLEQVAEAHRVGFLTELNVRKGLMLMMHRI